MATKKTLLALLLLTSCGKVVVEQEYASLQQEAECRTGHTFFWERSCEDDACIEQRVRAQLRQPLSRDKAVSIALSNNPALQARYEMLGIAKADVVQAGLLTNPNISIDWRLPGGKSSVESSLLFQGADLWQVPLRKAAARREQEAIHSRLLADILAAAADAKRTYNQRAYTQALLSLMSSLTSLSGKLRDRIVYRQEFGFSSDLDIAMSESAYGMQYSMFLDTQRMNMMAGLEMRRSLGLDETFPDFRLTDPFTPPCQPIPSKEALVYHALHCNPQIRALEWEIAQARASLRLAKARIWKDVGIGLAQEKSPGEANGFGPAIGIQIPIFDQNQAQIARWQFTVRKREKELAAKKIEILTLVKERHQLYTTACQQLAIYRDNILPSLQKALDYTDRYANTFQINTLVELHSLEAYNRAGQQHLALVRDAYNAMADLEELIGGPLKL